MVNPVHLKTLLEVIRTGSFAAAALRLGCTASAVSQQMSALEKDTGTRSFERSARTVSPTEAAVVMARHAVKVLTDMDALLASAARPGPGTGQELRLGIFPSLATFALPELLASPGWRDLGIDLLLSVAEPAQTIQGLRTGGNLDVALVYQVGQGGLAWPSSISRRWLGDDNFRVVLPASWGIRSGAEVTAEQLAGMPWIMHHPGTPDALVIERLFASCSLHPRVAAYCDDFNASLAMASAGLGAALVPELAMLDRPAGTVVLDVAEIRLARSIFALLIHEQNVQVGLFLDRLADVLGRRSIVPLPTSGLQQG
ncbi:MULTISPECIES: LysR family transcriptional regulator [unclassified Arthrobacter]|uniref:LysR family transcriptional regulator n=1 Tax=unclassified Arthrobacter TaxID=235627 RepID=UPI001E31AF9E|nr:MULTISPECIES: LysR family transcriptional regulator [unclassified Arthrobacter]MCC9145622.1 LysR family transcriptional regulator [Arthrobacter sp. zg-Y919]MDK1276851.1 LysR family transcriptional regulator [Arthrobacter sp. zg.Y919]WIB04213.1 LysR family transcriptional regulator [Arthrobacter sp. zg-Y919]